MLLVIDVGNTNTVFAVFSGEDAVSTWRISSDRDRTADEYALSLSELIALSGLSLKQITGVIISSVVPQTVFPLKMFSRKYMDVEPLVVGDGVKLPLTVKVDRPQEVGADRLVNAVAAFDKHRSAAVILDFGTATTFDVIDGKGDYLGGVIAPGINLSIDALHRAAAKLPEIAVERPSKVIGTNTVMAMQSGVYWGYVGLIEGIVAKIRAEFKKPVKIISTGGLSPLFAKATPIIDVLEPDLTIHGLKLLYELNTLKKRGSKR
jgi:type III pantothenate kinase